MANMADMTINSKNPLKNLLKLSMKHQAIELYKVCINHDPVKTFTFLRQRQLESPMHLKSSPEPKGLCF